MHQGPSLEANSPQLVENFALLYVIRSFDTDFTATHKWSLS
jgi:hypothetical protein